MAAVSGKIAGDQKVEDPFVALERLAQQIATAPKVAQASECPFLELERIAKEYASSSGAKPIIVWNPKKRESEEYCLPPGILVRVELIVTTVWNSKTLKMEKHSLHPDARAKLVLVMNDEKNQFEECRIDRKALANLSAAQK